MSWIQVNKQIANERGTRCSRADPITGIDDSDRLGRCEGAFFTLPTARNRLIDGCGAGIRTRKMSGQADRRIEYRGRRILQKDDVLRRRLYLLDCSFHSGVKGSGPICAAKDFAG
jgi:hypothetical protein